MSALLLAASPGHAQSPVWLLQNNGAAPATPYSLVDYVSNGLPLTARVVGTATPNENNFVDHAYVAPNGGVLFYVDQDPYNNGLGPGTRIVRGDGQVDPHKFEGGYTYDVVAAPNPSTGNASHDCRWHVVVAWVKSPTAGYSELQYMLWDPEDAVTGLPAGLLANCAGSGTQVWDYNRFATGAADLEGRLALAKPTAAGRQYLYVLVEGKGVYHYELPNATRTNFTTMSIPCTYVNSSGVPVSRLTAWEINSSTLGMGIPAATYKSNELELSADGTRLAWAEPNSNRVYIANLNATTGVYTGTTESFTITGLSVNKINGLEFAPGSNSVLFVTAGIEGNSTDGLFKVTRNSGGTFTPLRISGGAYGPQVANSYVEANYAGDLVVSSSTSNRLLRIDPASTGAINVIGSFAYPTATAPAGPRRLPRQIDGWHYNFAGTVYGPPSVTTPAPTATYSAPAVPGASYVFKVRRNGNLTSYPPQSSNQFTYTFTGANKGDNYIIYVDVTSTRNGNCTEVSTAEKIVAIRNPGDIERPAPGGPAPDPYPNPATSTVRVRLQVGETAEIRDGQGAVRAQATRRAGSPEETLLDVQTLPEGMYVVRVAGGSTVTTRRLLISNRK